MLNMSVDTTTWNACFAVINLLQSAMLLHAERPITLHPMEEEIYLRVFRSRKIPLGRREFRQLAEKAFILDYEDGEAYQLQGKPVETVAMIMSGHVDVFSNFDRDAGFAKINVSEAWEWVDSPQFLSAINAEEPPSAAVSLVASGPTQLCVWKLSDLRILCSASPQISVCLLSVLATDCAIKITKTERYLLSNETVQQATQALLNPDERKRRANSFSKLPITALQRMDGGHVSIDIGPAAIVAEDGTVIIPPLSPHLMEAAPAASQSPSSRGLLVHTKSARRVGTPSPITETEDTTKKPDSPPVKKEKREKREKKAKTGQNRKKKSKHAVQFAGETEPSDATAENSTEMHTLTTKESKTSIVAPTPVRATLPPEAVSGPHDASPKRLSRESPSSGSPVIEDLDEATDDTNSKPSPAADFSSVSQSSSSDSDSEPT